MLAGTIRRSSDDDHDLNLAAALARSSKDLEEQEYQFRSVARALTPFCSGMNVPDAPCCGCPAYCTSPRTLPGSPTRACPLWHLPRHCIQPPPSVERLPTARSPDRRAGAPGSRALRRTGGLDRRQWRRRNGRSPSAAVSSAKPTRTRSPSSPAVESSPDPIRARTGGVERQADPDAGLARLIEMLVEEDTVRSIERCHWRSNVWLSPR